MRVRILGSSAGGGLPQWNCRCANCEAARLGSPHIVARTQSSVAVSADGDAWFLLNVSPDIRQQIVQFPALAPQGEDRRGTPLAGCVLTDSEIDHTTGLLLLREGCRMRIYCTPLVRGWLHDWLPIGRVLSHFAEREWCDLALGEPSALLNPSGTASGLEVRAFELDRHVPRFVDEPLSDAVGSVIGLEIEDTKTGGKLVYAPGVASIGEPLTSAVEGADAVLMDGTFWSDDEPQKLGIDERTARVMGHLPVGDPEGSLPWLANLPARHRVYVHINNTNPMLRSDGREHAEVVAREVRIGQDGDEFDL